MKAMETLASTDQHHKSLFVPAGFILIALIGFIDHKAEHELELSIFYVFPIYLITWVTNQRFGIITSIASAAILLLTDILVGHHDFYSFALIWNSLIRFVFFIIITYLLSSLKSVLQRERELSRTDHLTAIANSRHFYETAKTEMERFQRYQRPFTIAYIDVDNFKAVNDQFGHSQGDLVLQTLAGDIRKNIRQADIAARLGGDEFALLCPETEQEAAQAFLAKLRSTLLNEIQKNNWPITLSIGAVTCKTASLTIDELMNRADELMYAVKSRGKNAIEYLVIEG